MASIKINIFANYLGVVISTALSFMVVPFYLKQLGSDSFGLIGIASMIQGWVMLLNSGLSPVTGREAARARSGAQSWDSAAEFFRTVDILLVVISGAAVLFIFASRNWLAEHWLTSSTLSPETIGYALCLLVSMTLTRLLTSVSRGILSNLEYQVWLNKNLIIFSIFRFALSIPLVYLSPKINSLFIWWLFISLLEYASIQHKIWKHIPVKIKLLAFNMAELKKQWKIITSLAFTSIVWVAITNIDKLILTSYLTLTEYGFYSLATLLSGGLIVFTQPIAQAYQPKLTAIYAAHGLKQASSTLRESTSWIVALIFPISISLIIFPNEALFFWTGDKTAASEAATLLRYYSLGNIFISLGSLLYMFQVSIGNVKKHIQGNIILALAYLPFIPYVIHEFGAEGVAVFWAITNGLIFFIWNVHVLKYLSKSLFPMWITIDTTLPLAMSFIFALIFKHLIQGVVLNRTEAGAVLVLITLSLFAVIRLYSYFISKRITKNV